MRNLLVSAALRAALPADKAVLPSSITPPLQFQTFGSETTAQASVALRGEEGDLTHSVDIGGYELPIKFPRL